jgi:spoIIIJ-associated protein
MTEENSVTEANDIPASPDPSDDSLVEGAGAEAGLAEEPPADASDVAPPSDVAPGSDVASTDDDDPIATLEHEGEVAADYLEGLLDILDLDGDLDLDVEGDRASVAIVGTGIEHLVGNRGATLDALQELTRLAVLQTTGSRSRLMLDIAGYRAARRDELTSLAETAIERVRETGEDEKLAPMNPFERKVVHDAVAAADGVFSESEGEEPQRRVVVRRS